MRKKKELWLFYKNRLILKNFYRVNEEKGFLYKTKKEAFYNFFLIKNSMM